jgi:hypothetical protein
MDFEHTGAQPDISELIEFAKTCQRVYPGPTNQLRLSHAGKRYESQKYVFGSLGRGFCRIFWNQHCATVAFRGTREIRGGWLRRDSVSPSISGASAG